MSYPEFDIFGFDYKEFILIIIQIH